MITRIRKRQTGRICAVCGNTTSPSGRKDTYGFGTVLRRLGITHREKAHPDCVQSLMLKSGDIKRPIMTPQPEEE